MHWILQDNLYNERNYTALVECLERMGIPFDVVKVLPFSSHLPWEERVIPQINPQGQVMVSGSVSLAKLGADRGWTPGSFHNLNHDYRVWREHLGEHLLNYDSIVCAYGEVPHVWDEFFIRPVEDTKTFSGGVYDWIEFDSWRHKVLELKETYTTLDEHTMVMMSPLKKIYREARFFVVDSKIATSSTYKIGTQVHATGEVPPSMTAYAEKIIQKWEPARAYVLDIALTDDEADGWNKVIEYNCINCSGFYDIDIQKFVMAIEQMVF
jgi:hypothetical protein